MNTDNQNPNENRPLMDFKEAVQISCSTKSSIWRGINDGTFPRPVKIGLRKIAFIRSEVMEWVSSRPRIKLQSDSAKEN